MPANDSAKKLSYKSFSLSVTMASDEAEALVNFLTSTRGVHGIQFSEDVYENYLIMCAFRRIRDEVRAAGYGNGH